MSKESTDVAARAKALLEGVTEGPWEWDGDSFSDVKPDACPHGDPWTDHGPDLLRAVANARMNTANYVISSHGYDASSLDINAADAEFIAASRSLVPELVAELEQAQVVLQRVRALAWEWDNVKQLSDGQPSIVAKAFADSLFQALAIHSTDPRSGAPEGEQQP